MYPNLEAELKRKKITREKLAKLMEKSNSTIVRKMSGETEFTYPEACLITYSIFEGKYAMEYLFQKDTNLRGN